MTFFSVVFFE